MYKSLEGFRHVVVQSKRTLSSYLGDYGDNANSAQDAHPTLYVSLYHKDKQVGHEPYSPTVVMTSHFSVPLEDLPCEIPVNIMHNKTRYTQSDSFCPAEAGSVIAHYIVDQIISQANEPHGQDLTDENVVLYFNGMVPMIKGLPILCYCLMYGQDSTMKMDDSILVTFSIIRKPVEGGKPLKGGHFMAALPLVAPVVLRYANLGKYSRVPATQKQILSVFRNPPMDDPRSVYLCRLINEVDELKVTVHHPNVWFRCFCHAATKLRS